MRTLQVNEVKDVMVENIEKVLQRGERIELLVGKTDDLRNQVGGCTRRLAADGNPGSRSMQTP